MEQPNFKRMPKNNDDCTTCPLFQSCPLPSQLFQKVMRDGHQDPGEAKAILNLVANTIEMETKLVVFIRRVLDTLIEGINGKHFGTAPNGVATEHRSLWDAIRDPRRNINKN